MRSILMASAAILIASSAPGMARDYAWCARTNINPVFGDFLRMGSKFHGPMPQSMPTRFAIRGFNLPRHLSRGAMPNEDDTANLA